MDRRRTYFGVLYATAEEGPVGVKVLDVIPGSPAALAGFEGVNAPPSQTNDLVKLGLIALMMSPVGPFAMPLVIAHDMYKASRSPGDLIVAVGDQQVRDAVEFSQEMRRYQPGDTVTFSVVRKGKPLQIPVQLGEEPS
jgi:S1-C subfamily serine protease